MSSSRDPTPAADTPPLEKQCAAQQGPSTAAQQWPPSATQQRLPSRSTKGTHGTTESDGMDRMRRYSSSLLAIEKLRDSEWWEGTLRTLKVAIEAADVAAGSLPAAAEERGTADGGTARHQQQQGEQEHGQEGQEQKKQQQQRQTQQRHHLGRQASKSSQAAEEVGGPGVPILPNQPLVCDVGLLSLAACSSCRLWPFGVQGPGPLDMLLLRWIV
jgi:hypothetical protein